MDREALSALFARDLLRLAEEISLFDKEEDLWSRKGEIVNTSGNLCLHINGNLNHFIGAVLGATGYVRDRDHEFSGRDYSKQYLINMTLKTSKTILPVIKSIEPDTWNRDYPIRVFDDVMTTQYFLLHLYGHLNYHLGQINYLRRMIKA